MDIGDRLKIARKSMNPVPTQSEMGKVLGVRREVITSYEVGRVVPNDPFLRLYAQTYNINYAWLKFGTGDMVLKTTDDAELVEAVMTGENEFAKSLFISLAKLGDDQWRMVESIINQLKETGRD